MTPKSDTSRWPGVERLADELNLQSDFRVGQLRCALEPLLDWNAKAFVLLAGLKEAVDWELAPPIKKEIARLTAGRGTVKKR